MKKIVLFLLLTPFAMNAQNYGFNATSTPENLTPTARQYVVDFADNVFYFVFRQDKYTTKAPELDINNVIALNSDLAVQGKELRIIYTFNPRNEMSIADNFYAYNQFINAGVKVPVFRCGNEVYFKAAGFNGNWETYLNTNLSLFAEIDKYDVTVIIPYSENNEEWNTKCANYINARPNYAPDVHIYYSKTECPILNTLVNDALPQEKIEGFSSTKNDFYRSLYEQIVSSNHLQNIINDHNLHFPDRQMYVTEYGAAVGVGNIGNVFGGEMANDWFVNECKKYSEIEVLCKFNLGSVTGVITDASKKDLVTGTVKRLGYYTIQNSIKYKNAEPIKPVSSGTYTFSFHNSTDFDIAFDEVLTLENCYISSVSYEGIKGDYWYSSSGATAWWATGSVKTYEINGAKVYDYIPSLSYGYITVTVIPFKEGCMDSNYLEYDPSANLNTGCNTLKVYGSLDKNCQNYNPNSNVIEDCIPIEVTICYKERLIFKSLGCKVDKTCKINNCK